MLNTTEELIADIRAGKMIILMDDENRENEGDLVIAAELVTPEIINFMVTHGRGLVCLTITQEQAEKLNLHPQTGFNHSPFHTNFTVSIEAAEGVTTGISASDRAKTIKTAIAPHTKASDLVQPGHIFPIVARNGGVLVRAGHTEASSDFARLAGLIPAGVIVEILNDDGTMARRPDLEIFAQKHNLKIGTIADLIKYRRQNEITLEALPEQILRYKDLEFSSRYFQNIYQKSQQHLVISNKNSRKSASFKTFYADIQQILNNLENITNHLETNSEDLLIFIDVKEALPDEHLSGICNEILRFYKLN